MAMQLSLLLILWVVLVIYTVRSIFERTDLEQNTKILWTILILLAPVFGLVIYYFFGEQNRK